MLNDAQRALALARGRGVLQAESQAIQSAEQHLGDEFLEAADAIVTALEARGRVCVTGVGKARLIGDKISATLASTGSHSYSLDGSRCRGWRRSASSRTPRRISRAEAA